MSDIVPADRIERIVGVERHVWRHYARAVSLEQRVYVLHSKLCREARPDLRECPYSLALDNGIDEDDWGGYEDTPVVVQIGGEERLVPVRSI